MLAIFESMGRSEWILLAFYLGLIAVLAFSIRTTRTRYANYIQQSKTMYDDYLKEARQVNTELREINRQMLEELKAIRMQLARGKK
jgi:sensor histidine kinase YesM